MARKLLSEEERMIPYAIAMAPKDIERLKKLAVKQKIPHSILARICILRRLDQEDEIAIYETDKN